MSNFSRKELEDLLKTAKVKPAVHQIKTHPYLQQQSFLDWHKQQGIGVTAYSPLGNQNHIYDALIETPTITKIAKKHGVSGNQVVLAWGVKRRTSVIPKCVNEGRIKSNYECLKVKLDNEDMKEIAKMDGSHQFNNPRNWGYKIFADLEGA